MSLQPGSIDRAKVLDRNGAQYHEDVVRFLSRPQSYPHAPREVQVIETHISLVFIAGELVYKLKRPIRLDYLDCRSLAARRHSCESEFELNQQLAAGVYLQTLPVTRDPRGTLALGGNGDPVEWLVVMRCLDHRNALDHLIEQGTVTPAILGRVCATLAQFYRAQPPIRISENAWIDLWREKIELVRRSLTDSTFKLPAELTGPPLRALLGYILDHRAAIVARLGQGRIIDGHGDLKPEHVYLGSTVLVIDRLEFDERLRWCDPFDEITFLGLECDRLGAPWVAPVLVSELAARLHEPAPQALLRFYRCYRACLRARLMIEHLRDEEARTPELWPQKARAYLAFAADTLPLAP